MIKLVMNENMKIYRRIRTWVLILIYVAICITPTFFMNISDNSNWQEELKQQNASYEQSVTEMNEGASSHLSDLILINNYRLEHNIPPDASMWSVVEDWMFVLPLATLFIVVIASDIVASEYAWGTIKLLLIRPVSRRSILFSKYIAVLLFGVVMIGLTIVESGVIGGFIHGFDLSNEVSLSVQNGIVHESSLILHTLQLYAMNSVNLLMIITMAFMISAVFRSSVLAIVLSFMCLFFGNLVAGLAYKYEWAKYLLFANTNLTQYLDGGTTLTGKTMTFSLVVLAVYFILFHLVSYIIFTKRDVSV